ncbi:MAG: hypothetical protein WDW38_007113 [Sanguina aurantia]
MALKMRVQASARPSLASRRVVKVACNAQSVKQVSTAVAAAALAAVVGFGNVDAAFADISGLTPCSQSKAFEKLQKKELKGLTKRDKLYEAGSAPDLALKATMERTQNRFKNYADAGLLCGADGLPHLIADPGLALKFGHAGEVFIPTIGFLYVAGYIGYVGRQYIMAVKKAAKPIEKEIIIDVPLAIKLAWQGAGWPLATIQELRSGDLLEKDENITISPR